ncbi:MAG: molecular chaperone HtpG [Anaerolineae bacterium]|nr:molecular chaperone HtpG [Anaerolineae bacterium]
MTDTPNTTYTFQAEIQQLLHILVHSLYTERDIFLRELISNASDALNRMQFEMLTQENILDPDAELAIHIAADKDAKTLTITDTGVGLNREEMIHNLGTIAQSGAAQFLRRMADQAADKVPATDLIGQFGVGFYSVFMVAEKVTVTSRSFRPDDTAWAWTSDGGTTYTIEPAEQETRGTTITVYLTEEAGEFLDPFRLRNIIKKHSDFIAFPITLDGEIANQQTAIWRRPAREVEADDYAAFYRQLTLDFNDPLVHLHVVADAPVQFYSVLFIPEKADRGLFSLRTDHGLKLYARKVLIQEYNKDFLPNYLRFVDGVVDSEDLPLNVARESIQATRAIKRIGVSLKGKLLGELERIAEEEPERYAAFWDEFGGFLKEGIATESGDAARLAKLLRFHSSVSDGKTPTVTLDDYVARMKDDQEHIYYILASDLVSVRHSPHLDSFRALDYEVLILPDTVDSFMLINLTEYEGRSLRNVDDASLDLPDAPDAETDGEDTPVPLDEKTFDRVRARFVDVLGQRVTEVRESHMLKAHPVRLVAPEGEADRNMQRVRRMIEQDYAVPRRILEINRRHPIIHDLAAWLADDSGAPVINQVVEQLYDSALLLDGLHPNPADMVGRIQSLMEQAIRRGE